MSRLGIERRPTTRSRRAGRCRVERGDEASSRAVARTIRAVAIFALLSVAGYVHRTAGFPPSQASEVPCRQIDPPDAPRPESTTPANPEMSARLSAARFRFWCRATFGSAVGQA